MKRRKPGHTWLTEGVLSCGWGEGKNAFGGNPEMLGMRGGPLRVYEAIARYQRKGVLNNAEKKFMRELNRQYKIYCRRNDRTPLPFPHSLGEK